MRFSASVILAAAAASTASETEETSTEETATEESSAAATTPAVTEPATEETTTEEPAAAESGSSSTVTAQAWGQCGGSGWTGATTCAAGTSCVVQNEWYSQCLSSAARRSMKSLRRI
ncbi:pectin lyase [Colletotrichum kahawae]|uniref:Pectin lyase n=1 Tax=Colletotrichum kahawae TaxID=34407 RepID=A0AAD9YIV7_COLKA|nr:pectin lyase [Colletotrichum kahawae]